MSKVRQLMLHLRFAWWMVTEDRTVLYYFLVITLALGLMITLDILGMAAH